MGKKPHRPKARMVALATERLQMRCTPHQRATIEAAARERELMLSAYLLAAALHCAGVKVAWPDEES